MPPKGSSKSSRKKDGVSAGGRPPAAPLADYAEAMQATSRSAGQNHATSRSSYSRVSTLSSAVPSSEESIPIIPVKMSTSRSMSTDSISSQETFFRTHVGPVEVESLEEFEDASLLLEPAILDSPESGRRLSPLFPIPLWPIPPKEEWQQTATVTIHHWWSFVIPERYQLLEESTSAMLDNTSAWAAATASKTHHFMQRFSLYVLLVTALRPHMDRVAQSLPPLSSQQQRIATAVVCAAILMLIVLLPSLLTSVHQPHYYGSASHPRRVPATGDGGLGPVHSEAGFNMESAAK